MPDNEGTALIIALMAEALSTTPVPSAPHHSAKTSLTLPTPNVTVPAPVKTCFIWGALNGALILTFTPAEVLSAPAPLRKRTTLEGTVRSAVTGNGVDTSRIALAEPAAATAAAKLGYCEASNS